MVNLSYVLQTFMLFFTSSSVCFKHGIVIKMGLMCLDGIFTVELNFGVFSCMSTCLVILYAAQEFSGVLDVYNLLTQVDNA